jgi:hypothetical protein
MRAKESHQAARYPGDLAFELLPNRMSITRRFAWAGVASGAIAAVIAISIFVNRSVPKTPRTSTDNPSQLANAAPTTEPTYTPFAVAQVTDFPDGVTATPTTPSDVDTFVPSYQAIAVASVPSFPSFDTVLEEQTKQSQSTDESSTNESSNTESQ